MMALSIEEGVPMLPCLFKRLTGIPCPGCGTQRALVLLFQGKWYESLMMNPLGILLVVLAVVFVCWGLYDLSVHRRTLHRALHSRWPNYTVVIAALLTLANWIWNIYKGG